MLGYATIVDLLRQRVQEQPQQIVYRFLNGDQVRSLTYGELDQQVQSITAWLEAHTPTKARILLVYPYEAGLEFIAAFLACLYAGRVAVASHPPRNRSGLVELYGRYVESEAAAILSTRRLLPKLQTQLVPPDFKTDCLWCATDTLPAATTTWNPIPVNQLAFLQYTSGSTGAPKGVMVTHACLMQNQELLRQAFGHTSASIGVGWLPLFHDMGLIGNVLQALYVGAACVLMSPIDFVQKPFRWLEAISKYRATTSGAPNFAYDLLCHKITDSQLSQLDLSSWEVAFTGAEPVRVETLNRFSAKFAACGFRPEAFYPCYGMAEATLFVSGGDKLTPPTVLQVEAEALNHNQIAIHNHQRFSADNTSSDNTSTDNTSADNTSADNTSADNVSRSIVSCGRAWLDTEIKIVDPHSLEVCPQNQVGEIWVAGSGLGQGYWHQPELTHLTFQATVLNQPEADHHPQTYLRTGDLGFLHAGELFITGRLHDVLVFWGFNHYPQLIEQTVAACHPGFRPNSNAAFSIKVRNEERLVVAQEIERAYRNRLSIAEVTEQIRWRIFEEHFIDVYQILLLKPGSLPKTSSGKIQRSACRQLLLNNQLDVLEQWQQSDDSLSDPASTMERYLNPTTHLKRYAHLAAGRVQRWMGEKSEIGSEE